MKTKVSMIVLAVVSLFSCHVFAADDARADKTRFNSLLRELRIVEAEYNNTINQAMSEKHQDDQTSLETKSKIMALADKRDRILDRLTIISLRHGWEIPDSKNDQNGSKVSDEKKRIFAPADEVIRERFAQQAKKIAEGITLPIISINSQAKEIKKEKTPLGPSKEVKTAKKSVLSARLKNLKFLQKNIDSMIWQAIVGL